MHARVLPQAYVRLPEGSMQDRATGRLADVIEIGPVMSSTTGSCNGAANCARNSRAHGYGTALLWIDHAHGILLKYEERGLPASTGAARHFVYRVTSLSSTGPTPAQLAYQAPVAPTTVKTSGTVTSHGSGLSGRPGMGWSAPSGFVSLRPPIGSGNPYTVCGTGQGEDTQGRPSSADAVFSGGFRSPASGGGCGRPFVYVQEQRRAFGLPPALKQGHNLGTGRCSVFTGTYPSGHHWISASRGKVVLLAVSDALTESNLAQWLRGQVCR
jgi:hypothetical protein